MVDKIIFEDRGIVVEIPAEPASIRDFADVIIKCRKATSFPVTQISDDAVFKLLETAFYLSMRSDEGRFPRLRIASGKAGDGRLAVKFKTPVEFSNVHELRRFSSTAESPAFALMITESQDGGLSCLGLANVGHLGHGSLPGRPEILSPGEPSIRIWVEGPGHVFVREGTECFEYRAGRVRVVFPAWRFVPRLREFARSTGKALHQRAIESTRGILDAERYFGGYLGLSNIITSMLERILGTCLELRHGGAFVIVPGEEGLPESYDISCKYPLVAPDLGEDIVNYWSTHIYATHAKKEGIEEYDRCLQQCYGSKARLMNNVDAVAHMSAADGCVVLTGTLRMLGFGGSILVSEKMIEHAKTRVKLSNDAACGVSDFLRAVGGQRHQSAARLAIKHSDVLVLVVSQDAELSVFARDDEGFLRGYRPVDPSDPSSSG